MNFQVSDNVNYSGQTTTVPNGWSGQPYNAPHICPGCGRCRDCGRPYETQPFTPWPGYPNPYVGDVPGWTEWGPTCGLAVNSANSGLANIQVWQ